MRKRLFLRIAAIITLTLFPCQSTVFANTDYLDRDYLALKSYIEDERPTFIERLRAAGRSKRTVTASVVQPPLVFPERTNQVTTPGSYRDYDSKALAADAVNFEPFPIQGDGLAWPDLRAWHERVGRETRRSEDAAVSITVRINEINDEFIELHGKIVSTRKKVVITQDGKRIRVEIPPGTDLNDVIYALATKSRRQATRVAFQKLALRSSRFPYRAAIAYARPGETEFSNKLLAAADQATAYTGRKRPVGGNWKSAVKTRRQAHELTQGVINEYHSQGLGADSRVRIVLFPTFNHISVVREVLVRNNMEDTILLGAQDISTYQPGAHTGEVNWEQLMDQKVGVVLLGHSEPTHHEYKPIPDSYVAAQLEMVHNVRKIGYDLKAIVAVGETRAQRKAGQTFQVLERMIRNRFARLVRLGVPANEILELLEALAYEPVWAIGTGDVASDEDAAEAHYFIRAVFVDMFNQQFATELSIEYGGSMKVDNALGLLRKPGVDAGLLGGASLEPVDLVTIAKSADTVARETQARTGDGMQDDVSVRLAEAVREAEHDLQKWVDEIEWLEDMEEEPRPDTSDPNDLRMRQEKDRLIEEKLVRTNEKIKRTSDILRDIYQGKSGRTETDESGDGLRDADQVVDSVVDLSGFRLESNDRIATESQVGVPSVAQKSASIFDAVRQGRADGEDSLQIAHRVLEAANVQGTPVLEVVGRPGVVATVSDYAQSPSVLKVALAGSAEASARLRTEHPVSVPGPAMGKQGPRRDNEFRNAADGLTQSDYFLMGQGDISQVSAILSAHDPGDGLTSEDLAKGRPDSEGVMRLLDLVYKAFGNKDGNLVERFADLVRDMAVSQEAAVVIEVYPNLVETLEVDVSRPNLLVIYLGDDSSLADAVRAVLGNPELDSRSAIVQRFKAFARANGIERAEQEVGTDFSRLVALPVQTGPEHTGSPAWLKQERRRKSVTIPAGQKPFYRPPAFYPRGMRGRKHRHGITGHQPKDSGRGGIGKGDGMLEQRPQTVDNRLQTGVGDGVEIKKQSSGDGVSNARIQARVRKVIAELEGRVSHRTVDMGVLFMVGDLIEPGGEGYLTRDQAENAVSILAKEFGLRPTSIPIHGTVRDVVNYIIGNRASGDGLSGSDRVLADVGLQVRETTAVAADASPVSQADPVLAAVERSRGDGSDVRDAARAILEASGIEGTPTVLAAGGDGVLDTVSENLGGGVLRVALAGSHARAQEITGSRPAWEILSLAQVQNGDGTVSAKLAREVIERKRHLTQVAIAVTILGPAFEHLRDQHDRMTMTIWEFLASIQNAIDLIETGPLTAEEKQEYINAALLVLVAA